MVSRRRTLQSVGALLAGVGSGCLAKLRPSSERVRWRRQIDGTPHFADGTLYVMGRLRLRALSPGDGQTLWTRGWARDERDGWSCLSRELGIDDERLYVAGCDGLRALRRSDGDREWFAETSLRSGVAVGAGRVYANGDDLLAVDAASGEVDWRVPTDGERLTRPAVASGTVVHTNRVDGIVTAFGTDGEQQWEYRTGVETRSPTIAGDTVYVATAADPGRAGELLALNLADGSVRWRAGTTGTVKRGTRPVVGDQRVFLGCNGTDAGRLIALDRADGAERWTFTDENSSVYEPALGDGVVYAGSNDDHVYAFDRDGQPRWELETDRTVGAVVAGDELVFASSGALLGLSRE